jgi:replicative DNA helicase
MPKPNGHYAHAVDVVRQLPDNLDAERLVLGGILVDDAFHSLSGILGPDDFAVENHRRIFLRMGEVHSRGERIDRVTTANELNKHGQLQSVGGVGYLASLDEGLGRVHNLEGYAAIVKQKATYRRICATAQLMQVCASLEDGSPGEIIAKATES